MSKTRVYAVAKVFNKNYGFEHTELFAMEAPKWKSQTSISKIKEDILLMAKEKFEPNNMDVKDIIVLDEGHFYLLMKMENPTLNHKNLGRFQAYAVIKAFNERNEISYVGGAKIELDSSMTDEKVPGLVRALESDVLDKLRNHDNMDVLRITIDFCDRYEYMKAAGDPLLKILFKGV